MNQQIGIAWGTDQRPPELLVFEVQGDPEPKGNLNARPFFDKNRQKWGAICYDPSKGSPWRKAVHAAVTAARYAAKLETITHGVILEAVFRFARPQGHHQGDDRARPLRASAPRYSVSHQCGDLGKLLRAIEDEITEAKAWTDDSLVVGYGASTKLWAEASGVTVRILAAT